MDFNLVNNIEVCLAFKSEAPMNLVRYSHIPTMIISMLIGVFIFVRNKSSLVNRIMLAISLFFSLWVFLSLLIWEYGYNSTLTMFAWSLLGIFNSLVSISCLYLMYVFLEKKDISFTKKLIFFSLLMPIIILAPTRLNLTAFDAVNCNALEWQWYSPYYYILGIIVFIWILVLALSRYRKSDEEFRKQIILLTIGIEAFILVFVAVGFLISYLVSSGIISDFNLELYALFGMPVFMGLIAYLIVRYKAFDIKLIGAQALVIALIILIGSQFFFIQSKTNMILNSITFVLVTIFGFFLIRSVKAEVKRKEELQIMSDRLAESNEQLKKLDNAKSEFISIASHQLRTPLTAVKGFVSLMLEGSYGKVTKHHQEVLNKVYLSNERLIQLVEDLLNISRIESGRMEYHFVPVDVFKVCQELIDTFSIRAKDKKLYLELKEQKGAVTTAETDMAKIREVISNLIDNAIKYTPRGGVKVKVSQSGTNVRVEVVDTGMGIDPKQMPYLFMKFSRGEGSSRVNAGGTGLGLYVGRSMMEALGGKIWAESEGVGKGAKFIVDVPIKHN